MIQTSITKNRSLVKEIKIKDDNNVSEQIIACTKTKRKISKAISRQLNSSEQIVPHDCRLLYNEKWFDERLFDEHKDILKDDYDLIPLATQTQLKILKRHKSWFIDASFEESELKQKLKLFFNLFQFVYRVLVP